MCARAVCAQQQLASMRRVVLVELLGAHVSHEHDVRAFVAAIAPAAQLRVIHAAYADVC